MCLPFSSPRASNEAPTSLHTPSTLGIGWSTGTGLITDRHRLAIQQPGSINSALRLWKWAAAVGTSYDGARQKLMKVLELNQGGVTCNEVLAVLRDHGANKQGSQRRALPSECQARASAHDLLGAQEGLAIKRLVQTQECMGTCCVSRSACTHCFQDRCDIVTL